MAINGEYNASLHSLTLCYNDRKQSVVTYPIAFGSLL